MTAERHTTGAGGTGDAVSSRHPSLLVNWVSLTGLVLAASSFFAVVCLLAIAFFRGYPSPYIGVLTYLVAPLVLSGGLALMVIGAVRERRRRRRLAPGEIPRHPRIDLNLPRHRHAVLGVALVTFAFLLVTALGSYQAYHYTESVTFCGETCHAVMEPERTAYQNSPHARVSCVQCHIGWGAGWFVKSKLSGSYQVYSTLADKFPRPIPTPIENLRPAQETCERCHWPKKFFGSVERVNRHYLADEQNSPWTIRLLMKIGGGDPERGPVGGIHWHMNIANRVEYIAADERRQVIPWVRLTTPDGQVTVYQDEDDPLSPAAVAAATPRRMDCIDCHNRPSHSYQPPGRAVNLAMSTGRISTRLPAIKQRAVELLTEAYATREIALHTIEARLREEYAASGDPAAVNQAIESLQRIYSHNFFPRMRVDWKAYPDNIGHTIFPGCYRCHDGRHKSADGQVISHDCNACHVIIAQGADPAAQAALSPQGLEFRHPVDIGELWKEMNCAECHDGGLVE